MEKYENIVRQVLEENVNTRFSDNILYIEVIKKLRPDLQYKSFKEIFINYKYYRLPSIKTVERNRRLLEQKGLYVSPVNIKKEREKMIQVYLEYALTKEER